VTRPRTILRVRVVPRAARARLTREDDGRLRAHITAPPVDGAANRALIALLSEALDVPKRDIAITRGEHGRDKLVAISGRSEADVARALGGASAASLTTETVVARRGS